MLLKLLIGGPDGQTVEPTLRVENPIWLGRAKDSEVVLDSAAVSRKHAILEKVSGRLYVRRAGLNETLLNGYPLPDDAPKQITGGDLLQIAEWYLYIVSVDLEPEDRLLATSEEDILKPTERSGQSENYIDPEIRNAFFRGLGLDPNLYGGGDPLLEMEAFGARFRQLIEGIRDILQSDYKLASGAAEPEIFRPADADPLIRAPSSKEALAALVAPQGTRLPTSEKAIEAALARLRNRWTPQPPSLGIDQQQLKARPAPSPDPFADEFSWGLELPTSPERPVAARDLNTASDAAASDFEVLPSHVEVIPSQRRGRALFRVPRTMWTEIAELAELRLAPHDVLPMALRAALERTMIGRGIRTDEHPVDRLGRRMRARLLADERFFEVVALSSEVQDFQDVDALSWDWRVIPIREGYSLLTLRMTMEADFDGRLTTVDAQALHTSVEITVRSRLTRPARFVRDNWKWMLGSSGIGAIATIAALLGR